MTVYVIQNPRHLNRITGELEDKFDFTSAQRYGKLEFLLSPTAAPFNASSIIEELHRKLRCFGEGDYLLLVGNPVIIGMATAIAADYNNGKLNVLQWSGKNKKYFPILINNLFTSAN